MPIMDGLKMKAVQWALKQVQASPEFMRTYGDDRAKWTNWTTEAAVNHGYKASLWVYAAINKKARAAASIPWYVYRRNSSGTYEKIQDHPLQMLIDKPNDFTSRNNMIERLIMQLDLTGNSIFNIVTVGNVPVELWNINPDIIEPVKDQREFISHYLVNPPNGRPMRIETENIIHAMYIDPSNPYWGIAPLQAAARTVDTDTEALTWNKLALQNRAVTDGIFSVPEPLTTDQYRELRQQVREQHQGAKGARAPWILGGGAQWQQMSLSPADMDFIEGRKMTREEICAAFQVPPPLVGILDRANYSNMQEARRVFWLDTIIPLLDDLKESFNRTLTPYFGDGITLDYDTSEVDALADNVNEKIDAANKLFNMGIPFNEINKRLDLGFDEIEGGEIGYLPASLLPAGEAANYLSGVGLPRPVNREESQEESQEQRGSATPPKKIQAASLNIKAGEKPFLLKAFNLKTEEQKNRLWKATEKRRARWDLKLQREALEIFDSEREAIVKRFLKSGGSINEALKEIDPNKWKRFLILNYRGIIRDFGQATYDGFKSHFLQLERKEFDPYQELILAYIEEVAAEKVVMITETTMLQTRRIIQKYREEERTIDEIARELDKNFEDYSTHRAFRIARTEVNAASNYGGYMGAEQASEETGDLVKEWIDSRDDRVRDSHKRKPAGVGGEKIRFYRKFSNGLSYPGDMVNGPAKEVIHCRCTLIYHPLAYIDPGEIDPGRP